MKKSILKNFCGVFIFSTITLIYPAYSNNHNNELKNVSETVNKMFTVTSTATSISDALFKDILNENVKLYNVEVTMTRPNKSQSLNNISVAKLSNGTIASFSLPNTTQPYPQLKKVFNNKIKLDNEINLKKIESILDNLFPISTSFGFDDIKHKKIIQKKDHIYFIRGKFLNNLKGFVFKINSVGKIVDITYSLRIKE